MQPKKRVRRMKNTIPILVILILLLLPVYSQRQPAPPATVAAFVHDRIMNMGMNERPSLSVVARHKTLGVPSTVSLAQMGGKVKQSEAALIRDKKEAEIGDYRTNSMGYMILSIGTFYDVPGSDLVLYQSGRNKQGQIWVGKEGANLDVNPGSDGNPGAQGWIYIQPRRPPYRGCEKVPLTSSQAQTLPLATNECYTGDENLLDIGEQDGTPYKYVYFWSQGSPVGLGGSEVDAIEPVCKETNGCDSCAKKNGGSGCDCNQECKSSSCVNGKCQVDKDSLANPVTGNVVRNSITGAATSDGSPQLTRAEVADILVRQFSYPINTQGGPHFADVPKTYDYYKDIETLSNRQITAGCAVNPLRYCPDQMATRGQAVTFVVRAIGIPMITPTAPPFSDVPVNHLFASFIATAKAKGIVNGYGDGTFRPDKIVHRDELRAMIDRAKQVGQVGAACGNGICEGSESCEWDGVNGRQKLCNGSPIPAGGVCSDCVYYPPNTCGNGICESQETCEWDGRNNRQVLCNGDPVSSGTCSDCQYTPPTSDLCQAINCAKEKVRAIYRQTFNKEPRSTHVDFEAKLMLGRGGCTNTQAAQTLQDAYKAYAVFYRNQVEGIPLCGGSGKPCCEGTGCASGNTCQAKTCVGQGATGDDPGFVPLICCGDGKCEGQENNANCPGDCPDTKNQVPIGFLDGISEDGVVGGWTLDPDDPEKTVEVHLYVDGPAGSGKGFNSIFANAPRSDIYTVTGFRGDHGFQFTLPVEFKDRKEHPVYAYGIDLQDQGGNHNSLLQGSPKTYTLNCPAMKPAPCSGTLIDTGLGSDGCPRLPVCCGNNQCEEKENNQNCPQDCAQSNEKDDAQFVSFDVSAITASPKEPVGFNVTMKNTGTATWSFQGEKPYVLLSVNGDLLPISVNDATLSSGTWTGPFYFIAPEQPGVYTYTLQMGHLNPDFINTAPGSYANQKIFEAFQNSPEAQGLSNEQFVNNLYQVVLDREPGYSGDVGPQYWLGRLSNGDSRYTLYTEFVNSKEYISNSFNKNLYKEQNPCAEYFSYDQADVFVERMYEIQFNRKGDCGGFMYWVNKAYTPFGEVTPAIQLTVAEAQCGNGRCEEGETSQNCPQDCEDNSTIECMDSDGGENYRVKGTVAQYNSNSMSDYCITDKSSGGDVGDLAEYICRPYGWSLGSKSCSRSDGCMDYVVHTCASDEVCEDGACIIKNVCGDGTCEAGENKDTCPQDCQRPTTCTNGEADGEETDLDCGGNCPACAIGQQCIMDGDCVTKNCNVGLCLPKGSTHEKCFDQILNQDETDVDCGGATCPDQCLFGQRCVQDTDCLSQSCYKEVCSLPHFCGDGVCDLNETSDSCSQDCDAPQKCNQCGEGFFNLCDEQECYGLPEGCYYYKTLVEGTCLSCSLVHQCEDYHEPSSCETYHCTPDTVCEWNEDHCQKKANCYDGVRGEGEIGVDCGGGCPPCPKNTPFNLKHIDDVSYSGGNWVITLGNQYWIYSYSDQSTSGEVIS